MCYELLRYFFKAVHDVSGVGDLCKQYGALFAVDTVASLGGVPLEADKLGIDAIYTGSQKVLSCPPGTAPISFSEKAVAKIKSRRYGLLQTTTRIESLYCQTCRF